MKDDVFNSIKWPDDEVKDQEKANIEFTHQMDYEEDEVDNIKLIMNKKTTNTPTNL